MNVGLYSFKTMKLKKTESLKRRIKKNFSDVDDILLYSENKTKIECRQALNEMIEDYKNQKIDYIIFENFDAISSDSYIRGRVLKELIKNHCNFDFLNEDDSLQFKIMMFQEEKIKEINDKRSRMGNKIAQANRRNESKEKCAMYMRFSTQEQLDEFNNYKK